METKLSFNFKTNQEVLKVIGFIDVFKGKWNQIEGKESIYLKELKLIATIESIGSSTRIEGVKMSNEEIEEFVSKIKITSFKSRDEQEVFGYYDTLYKQAQKTHKVYTYEHDLNYHKRKMGWKRTSVVKQKEQFIKMWQSGEIVFSSLRQHYGISRFTGGYQLYIQRN